MKKSSTVRRSKARGSSAAYVYRELRNEILTLAISPGEVMDESTLAKRYGLSRSPIREAFVRLAADGLLQTLPNKSTIVTPVEFEKFPKFMDAFDLMQRAVTRLAATEHRESDLQHIHERQSEFRIAVEKQQVLEMIAANREFHVAISEAGHNPYFTHLYTRLLDEERRLLIIYGTAFGDRPPPEIAGLHDDIIAVIERRDADEAERLAHEHAMLLRDRILKFMGNRRLSSVSLS